MVGVPGRSKACLTCRKRRKGCDLKRPECTQCKTAGLKCAGYNSERVFVVSTPGSRRPGYRAHTTPQTCATLPSWRDIRRTQASISIAEPHILAQPEESRRCLDHFWEVYFPSGRPLPAMVARSYTCAWTETARKLCRENDSLRYALGANCMLVTGRRNGTEWMLREAARLYGRALAGLRRSLSIHHGVRGDVSIATVKLLSMFEAFSQQRDGLPASQTQGLPPHHAGELALFIVRTPAAHVYGDAHNIFTDERVELALSALLQRRHLPLSTPEWKSIPWQQTPKNMKDILIDVLVDMPGLVQDFDMMRLCADRSQQAALRRELVQKCWAHDQQLLDWLSLLDRAASPGTYPSAHLVTHVAQVHGMTLFWTTSLVLYSILRAVSKPQDELPERMDPMRHTRNLAQALPLLLRPEAGLYGEQSAALPLEVALQYTMAMGDSSLESRALVETLKTLRDGQEDGAVRLIPKSRTDLGLPGRC